MHGKIVYGSVYCGKECLGLLTVPSPWYGGPGGLVGGLVGGFDGGM